MKLLIQDMKSKFAKAKNHWSYSIVEFFLFFINLFVGVVKFALSPLLWLINENVKMWRFAKADAANRTLTDNEKWFVASIPMLYTLTGFAGGVLAAVFTVTSFWEDIKEFFANLDFIDSIGDILKLLWDWLWNGLVWLWNDILLSAIDWLVEKAMEAFNVSPYFTLFALLVIGFLVIITYILFTERVWTLIVKGFYILLGSPDKLSKRIEGIYKRINQKLFIFLVGKERIRTRSQAYFKRVVLYSFSLTIYSLVVGFIIATDEVFVEAFETAWLQSMFISTVLLSAGFFAGTICFSLVARLLDIFARQKYALR